MSDEEEHAGRTAKLCICGLRTFVHEQTEECPVEGEEEPDLVNHPPHYGSHPSGVECITITEHFNFNMGNAIKYIWRADGKGNPLQDLEKAKWYIEREIKRRTSEG